MRFSVETNILWNGPPPSKSPRKLRNFCNKIWNESEDEGEVAFFSAKRWDLRNRADLIEFATPCHYAPVVGPYRDSNPLRLTVLAAMSADYTTAPQDLRCHLMPFNANVMVANA